MSSNSYSLLDCGDREKLEQFGNYLIIRPCPQAIWPKSNPDIWENIDARFERTSQERGEWVWDKNRYFFDSELERAGYEDEKKNNRTIKDDYKDKRNARRIGNGNKSSDNNNKETQLNFKKSFTIAGTDPSKTPVPKSWIITSKNGLKWQIEPNEFGNVGVFIEHWEYANDLVLEFEKKSKILNLFTYSGSNCVELVKKGHLVTAVDSSKSAMSCYTTNLEINAISKDGQRLILEDCVKFMQREIRRNGKYDAIMIDAPSYGRGTKGEVFKIEDDLIELLNMAKELMTNKSHLIVTLHSPRFTPKILEILASKMFTAHHIHSSEILPICKSGTPIPSGFLLKIQPI